MGLDQYLYRIRKTNLDENVVHDYEKLPAIRVSESDIDAPEIEEIRPYLQKVRASYQALDMKAIEAAFHASGISIGCISSSGITFSWEDQGEYKRFDIPCEDSHKFEVEKTECFYVCDAKRLKHWYKNYKVSDFFADHFGRPVLNCGYILITQDVVDDFNEEFRSNLNYIDVDCTYDENSAVFYHEWY